MENTEIVKPEDLETREPKSNDFDNSKFEGQRIKIESVNTVEVIDFFPEGNYDKNSTAKKTVVEITTEPIKQYHMNEDGSVVFGPELIEIPNKEGEGTHSLKIVHRFNLQKEGDQWIISKHPKANLWKFMRKLNVEKVTDLAGKYVTVTTTPSKNPDEPDKTYLSIVTA